MRLHTIACCSVLVVGCASETLIEGRFETSSGKGITGAKVRGFRHPPSLWTVPEYVGVTETGSGGEFSLRCYRRPDTITACTNPTHPGSIYRHSDSEYGSVYLRNFRKGERVVIQSKKKKS
jgi:hypothetical protein